MTFDWGVAKDQESPWNSVVVEVMATKAVEWLSRKMKISEEDSSQAPAIIMRWLKSKLKELSQFGQMEVGEYESLKSKNATRAQYQQWRKKVCFQPFLGF